MTVELFKALAKNIAYDAEVELTGKELNPLKFDCYNLERYGDYWYCSVIRDEKIEKASEQITHKVSYDGKHDELRIATYRCVRFKVSKADVNSVVNEVSK